MKPFSLLVRILQLVVLIAVVSCGGGGDGAPGHAPSISGLTYTPSSAFASPNGTVAISGTMNVSDAGGDVSALRMTTSAGADLSIPLALPPGTTSGSGTGQFVVSVDQPGMYTFEVWVVDRAGNASNRLTGTFEVLSPATSTHAPAISNLRYAPSQAPQAPTGSIPFTVSVDFSDGGADVASLRLVAGAGPDQTIGVPALQGRSNGVATVTFTMPVQSAGSRPFSVFALDAQGATSNELKGAFDVLAPATAAWGTLGVAAPSELFGVAWSGRQYVAVGAAGAVMTSPDVLSWQVRNSGVTHTLRSVAWSGARFVAVGHSADDEAIVIGSADGESWSVLYRSAPATSRLAKVIWAGTQFIAVGEERIASGKRYGLVLTSPDGLTWTQRGAQAMELGESGLPGVRGMTSVAWSGTMAVATGLDPGENPIVWFSTDLETWTISRLTDAAVALFPLSDIAWGNGRFVAASPVRGWDGGAPTFVSVDGRNWQSSSSSSSLPEMNAVTTGRGEFLAVGSAFRMSSADGLAWSVSPMSGCSKAVLWDGSRYIAVGTSICKSQ